MRFGSIFACAAVAPLLTAATQPLRLQPTSKWIVDYAENSCRLGRTFGEGDSKTLLVFESDSPDTMDMLLVGNPLKSSEEEIPVRFLPVQEQGVKGRAVKSGKEETPAILFSVMRLLPEDAVEKLEAKQKAESASPRTRPPVRDLAEERERKAQRQAFADEVMELQIDARRGRPVILETGSLGQAIKALDQCSRDSLKDWGVDPELEDKIARPVWAENPGNWIDSDDYPSKMLDEGQQSDVKARVLVDASGRVTKCTTLSHFKLPEFNKLVCDSITRNARFEPAELADGTKVPSYYTVKINFRIAS